MTFFSQSRNFVFNPPDVTERGASMSPASIVVELLEDDLGHFGIGELTAEENAGLRGEAARRFVTDLWPGRHATATRLALSGIVFDRASKNSSTGS